jgi:hypothetical protein
VALLFYFFSFCIWRFVSSIPLPTLNPSAPSGHTRTTNKKLGKEIFFYFSLEKEKSWFDCCLLCVCLFRRRDFIRQTDEKKSSWLMCQYISAGRKKEEGRLWQSVGGKYKRLLVE